MGPHYDSMISSGHVLPDTGAQNDGESQNVLDVPESASPSQIPDDVAPGPSGNILQGSTPFLFYLKNKFMPCVIVILFASPILLFTPIENKKAVLVFQKQKEVFVSLETPISRL